MLGGNGDQIGARACYNEAAAWMDDNQPDNLKLKRLQREAEQMLGVQSDTE